MIVVFVIKNLNNKNIDYFSPDTGYLFFYSGYFILLLSIPFLWPGRSITPFLGLFIIVSIIFIYVGANKFSAGAVDKQFDYVVMWRHAKFISYIIFFVSSVSLIILILSRGVAIGGDIARVRFTNIPFQGYFYYLGSIINIPTGIFLYLFYSKNKKSYFDRVHVLLIISSAILLAVFYGSRAVLFPILLQIIFFRHYFHKKINFLNVLFYLSLVGVMLITISYVRLISLDYNHWYNDYLTLINCPKVLWPVAPLIISLRIPIENFNLLLSIIPDHTSYFLGYIMLSPLITILPGSQILGQEMLQVVLGNDPELAGLAAVTLPGSLYADFGILGIVFGSFFVGRLLSYTYRMMFTTRKLLWILLYSIMFPQCIIWIYGGFNANLNLFINAMVIFLIEKINIKNETLY